MPDSHDSSHDGASQDGASTDGANEDLKAKMREALERKRSGEKGGVPTDGGPVKEKAHGSELPGGSAPKMHRRKAGGGGS